MPTGLAIVHWIGCINAIKCSNCNTFQVISVLVHDFMNFIPFKTRLHRLDANISPDRPSLTPLAFTGYFFAEPILCDSQVYVL